MLSVPQAAAVLKLDPSRVRLLCMQGRIKGAVKVGRNWVIPEPVKVKVGRNWVIPEPVRVIAPAASR